MTKQSYRPFSGHDTSHRLWGRWLGRGSLWLRQRRSAPAKDPNDTYKEAIILLSDGLNTQDRWYADAASIDTRQKMLCKNARDASVTVYTIQVNTSKPADPTSTVLSQCASDPSNFYMLTSATLVVATFKSIGTSLSKKKARPKRPGFLI